jgi:hypothetical protein
MPRFVPFLVALCASLVSGALAWQEVKPQAPPDYSGMYTFLREAEYVQVTVEDKGKVTGYISRFGDGESDKGAFLTQFFKQGKLDGQELTFTTDTVHGVWFEFKGKIERGAGKNPPDEAYYVLKGTVTQYRTDANKKVSAQERAVEWKRFPSEADVQVEKRN